MARLDIELTERCNNNCIHCYINQPENDRRCMQREMPAARIQQILDEAAALGCMTVRFTGGEPLLRPEFKDLYLHTRRLGIKVILFTNATLITQDLATLFKKYPPGEPVSITLYGMTRESYEAVSRKKGSFEAAMNGIQLLFENTIPMALKTIRLPERDDEISDFRKFAEKYSTAGESGGISMSFNLRGRRDSTTKNEHIRKSRATPQAALAIMTRDKESYVKDKKQFAEKFMRPVGADLFTCGCGKGGTVDAYGKFQPCLLMRAPDLVYDLADGTMEDALKRYFPEVLQKNAQNQRYLERCATCFLKGLCEQCPAWSYMENGTLDTPVEYLCSIAHEQARYLGLITPGENAWQVEDWQKRIAQFTSENKE